uniref:Uncharacterized protein n=1 Tax=Panagrolaimus superbus TaxID=310955 RepID=A0A914YTC8_9BILA
MFIAGHKAIYDAGGILSATSREELIENLQAEVEANQIIIRENVEKIDNGLDNFEKPQGGSTSKEEANLGKIEIADLKSLHLKDVRQFHAKRATLFSMSKHTAADLAAAPEPEEDNEAGLQEYVQTYAADPATMRPCFSYSLVSALAWTGCHEAHCRKDLDEEEEEVKEGDEVDVDDGDVEKEGGRPPMNLVSAAAINYRCKLVGSYLYCIYPETRVLFLSVSSPLFANVIFRCFLFTLSTQ